MRKSHTTSANSLRIAFIFLCSIALLVIAGFFLKLFLVLRASSFDSSHQYIVEIDESNTKGALVAFNPANKSVTVLYVFGRVDKTFGGYLDVPVDGVVTMPIAGSVSKFVEHMLFTGQHARGITIIDALRLLFFVNSLSPNDFHEQTITLPIDTTVTEKLLSSMFLDKQLYADNESISVVNATGESGIGTEVAHLLTTIGMNVVSVTSSNTIQQETSLRAFHTNTYTVERIAKLFHVSVRMGNDSGVSDISITIGKSSLSQLQ